MKWLLLILILLNGLGIHAQNETKKEAADLEKRLEKAKSDTARIAIYVSLAAVYQSFDSEKANQCYENAMKCAFTCNSKLYISMAINSNAYRYIYESKFDKALIYTQKAQEILNIDTLNLTNNSAAENIQLARIYNVIGMAYDYQSEYSQSVKYYLAANTINEKYDQKNALGNVNNNLGISYLYTNDLEKSREHFTQSYELNLELKDTQNAYEIKMNIGILNHLEGDTEGAMKTFHECAKIMDQIGNVRSKANCYTNIAGVYEEIGELDSAIIYLEKNIIIDQDLNDAEGLGSDYRILANVYRKKGSFQTSREYYEKALEVAQESGRKYDFRDTYIGMYELENSAGNFSAALNYHELYIAYQDSIQAEGNSRVMGRVEAESEFNQQLAIQKAEDEQKLKLEAEKRKRQSIIQYFIFAVMSIILFLVYLVWRSLKNARSQKALAEAAKVEIEKKNTEILDSIKYSQRIQQALLKDDSQQEDLPPYFLFFQPKDIVSGDFYWSYRSNDYWYIAVADCTGHGVPGAMLTMLGTAYLNEICASNKDPKPSVLLDDLKLKITTELGQKGITGESKDGMDISLIRLNLKTNGVEWSGANNPLYIVRDNELIELKGNKQPIGYSDHVEHFENHQIEIEKGDHVYLFSDGYADQFGGEKGKKFKYSNFKNLLVESSQLNLKTQQEKLQNELKKWQGEYEQLDDICIIGIKL